MAIKLVSTVSQKLKRELALMARSYNPSTWEAEKGTFPDVQNQARLHRKFQVSLWMWEPVSRKERSVPCGKTLRRFLCDSTGAVQHFMNSYPHSTVDQPHKNCSFQKPSLSRCFLSSCTFKKPYGKEREKKLYSIGYLSHPGIRVRTWAAYLRVGLGEAARWRPSEDLGLCLCPVPGQLLQE